MKQCMITFRSVAPAQRGESVLRRAGIDCTLRRTPRKMEEQGCGYSLILPCSQMGYGVEILRQQGIAYRKVYTLGENGKPEETML